MDRQIKQLLPCTEPWYARYIRDGEKKEFFKVICWALVNDGIGDMRSDHVIPIVSGDGCYPMEADYHNDYQGVELLTGQTEDELMEEPE
jgi:hypothetical protein